MRKKLAFAIFIHGILIILWGIFFNVGILIEDEKYFNLISIISLDSIIAIILIELSTRSEEINILKKLIIYFPIVGILFISTSFGIEYLLFILVIVIGIYGIFGYKYIDLYVLKNISFLPTSRGMSSSMVAIISIFATINLYLFEFSGIQINIVLHIIFFIFELTFLYSIIEKEKSYEKINIFIQISEYTAKEREEFARVLHDDIIQDLYAVKNYLLLKKPYIKNSIEIINNLEDRLRKLINFYKNETFEYAKPYKNIEAIFDSIKPLYPNKSYREVINITKRGERELKKIDILRTSLVVCKELINNIYKHSDGNYIILSIDADDNRLFIKLKSNGASLEDLNRIKNSKRGILLLRAMIETKGNTIEYEIEKDILKTEIVLDINR